MISYLYTNCQTSCLTGESLTSKPLCLGVLRKTIITINVKKIQVMSIVKQSYTLFYKKFSTSMYTSFVYCCPISAQKSSVANFSTWKSNRFNFTSPTSPPLQKLNLHFKELWSTEMLWKHNSSRHRGLSSLMASVAYSKSLRSILKLKEFGNTIAIKISILQHRENLTKENNHLATAVRLEKTKLFHKKSLKGC